MGAPDPVKLLNPQAWSGRIHQDGRWIEPQGGARDVTEPATGAVLTRTGVADAADMTRAIAGAAAAQPSWAALCALIDECPVIHAALSASRQRCRAINPSHFEFISQNSQIEAVRDFMASLPSALMD